ncbi:hypothetical protein POM88_049381 [Heracleum sosnowskyi]|uniref:Uncharacterized protein n=1 Tax=Heracleum sosnowskyi TaxID=360622 RepID=A0AAD8GY37_9APIA|nr:hypothetical protein POM88_049381 [Heracleum sosnowskyi]
MENLVRDDSWVIKLDDELNKMKDGSVKEMEQHWKRRSIYQLSPSITELNRPAYNPQVVSFGPLHHGQPHLLPMEVHKHRALLIFMKRSNKSVQYFMESLAPLAEDLKESYDFLDRQEHTNELLKLLILDGCFMLEILRMSSSTEWKPWPGTSADNSFFADYAPNDPVFSNHGRLYILPYIMQDMLLLENQLPMMLLENLWALQNDETMHDEFLNYHMVKLYSPGQPVPDLGKCLHLLDVYRRYLLFHVPRIRYRRQTRFHILRENKIIHSAIELQEAGIRFETSKSTSLTDISFRSGVLRLPGILVDVTTEAMFLNLMAFERFHVGAGNGVTAYIFFMSDMLRNARDVNLLHLQGIIQNAIGSDEDVLKLFHSLSKNVTLDPNGNLEMVQMSVQHYCQQRRTKWRAYLTRTYFTNPWASLSLLASLFLFALTITQTVFTVVPYFDPAPRPPPPPR